MSDNVVLEERGPHFTYVVAQGQGEVHVALNDPAPLGSLAIYKETSTYTRVTAGGGSEILTAESVISPNDFLIIVQKSGNA